MIIFDMRKPIECETANCVGVTGENLAFTQEFYIKGISDDTISYTLHLRFADGSVNTVTPDLVIPDDGGTNIRWILKKNDIFAHGYFDLQIEGRNSYGLIFQTEIVRMYADESIPVEDKSYENPNSETLKLREEAYAALEEIKAQEKQIEENLALINSTSLSSKADKATTLSGYGITDAYTKKESKIRFGLNINVTFDESYIPLTVSTSTGLSAGNFATGNKNVKYAFIHSGVTSIDSGTFANCTDLTDVYIDNTEGAVKISSGSIPSTATVHYVDDFNADSYIVQALIAVKKLIGSKADNTDLIMLQEEIEMNTENIENKLDDSDGSVKTSNLSAYSVSSQKIQLGAVNSEKIADGAVKIQHIDSSYLDDEPSDKSGPYVNGNCLITSRGVYNALSYKADKASTLEEYGIMNAYTKDETENLVREAVGQSINSTYSEEVLTLSGSGNNMFSYSEETIMIGG